MTLHVGDRVAAFPSATWSLPTWARTLRSVAHKLSAEDVGMLVVCEVHRHPVGVISERDVVGVLAQGADPDE